MMKVVKTKTGENHMAISYKRQHTIDYSTIREKLDPNDRLVRLAEIIDWERLHDDLSPYYSRRGRQALPIRLMVGLHLLKHLYNTSDERAVEELRSNNYWMYFCDVLLDEAKGKYVRHLSPASLCHFRQRLGPEGMARLEKVIRDQILHSGQTSPRVLVMDSTAMPKNIAYPTDSALLFQGRRKLLRAMHRIARATGKALPRALRSFTRKARKVRTEIHKLGPGRPERIRKGTLELARQTRHVLRKAESYLGSVERSVRRGRLHLEKATHREVVRLRRATRVIRQVIRQTRKRFQGIHLRRKIFSLHEPQVSCIRTGKQHRLDDYGSKVYLAMDARGYLLAHQEAMTNRADVKFLEPGLKQWEQHCGTLPELVAGDRGFHTPMRSRRGRLVPRWSVPRKGRSPSPDQGKKWFRRGQSLRAGLEGIIGHLKRDHRLGRSYYRGFAGDRINVCLAVSAWNLKKWDRMARARAPG
jgi:IS5 family transposase